VRNLTPARVFSAALVWAAVAAMATTGFAQYYPGRPQQSYLEQVMPGRPQFRSGLLGQTAGDPFAGMGNLPPGLPPEVYRAFAGADPFFPSGQEYGLPPGFGRVGVSGRTTGINPGYRHPPHWTQASATGGITNTTPIPGRRRDDDDPRPAVGPVTMPIVSVGMPRVHYETPKPFRVTRTPRATTGGGGWLIGGLAAVVAAVGGGLKWLIGSKDRPTPPWAGPSNPPPAPTMIGVGVDGRAGMLIRPGRPDLQRP
jgi:hypothetical protein